MAKKTKKCSAAGEKSFPATQKVMSREEEEPLDIIFEKYPHYRILGETEILQTGDEYYSNGVWGKTGMIGQTPGCHVYRRRIDRHEDWNEQEYLRKFEIAKKAADKRWPPTNYNPQDYWD